jgi:hypothetical protein
MHELSILYLLRDSRHREKPFHERNLTKSGFGKPKAAKLDNPSDAVLRERGHGAVLGGRRQSRWHAIRHLSAHAMPARRFAPPWCVEEQDACYVVG